MSNFEKIHIKTFRFVDSLKRNVQNPDFHNEMNAKHK